MKEGNVLKRKYPIVTPDTLRRFLHVNKALYDTYVKKNVGYTDTNGSTYNGTVNNFGGELLLESRKLLLNKPSISKVNVSSEFLYYFDIKYAGDVSTYEQQNLIICTLREDVFTDNHTWKIKFPCDSRPEQLPDPQYDRDTIDLGIVHSLSKSDGIICKEAFFQTDKDVVIIKDGVEIPLKFSEVGNNTIYVRPWNCGKEFLYGITDPDDPTGLNTIGSITHEMTNSEWKNQIMFYIQNDALNTVQYEQINATAYDDFPLLRYGANGHDNSFVFPGMIPGRNISVGNLPENLSGEWFIELIPASGYSFTIPTNINDKSNDYCVIDKVVYYQADTYDGIRNAEYEYTLPSEYVHHFPNNNIIGYMYEDKMYTTQSHSIEITPDNSHVYYDPDGSKYYTWNGSIYKETEYGGIQYYEDENEVVHTYASFNNYKYNYLEDDGKWIIIALLRVEYQTSTLYNYEYLKSNYLKSNAVTGIHINSTSMPSDNGIIQKNGITHNMSEFDGLPLYFKNFYTNRNVCISRSIIYAIRDDLNHENQLVVDKPTAALIADSGYPISQTEYTNEEFNDIELNPDANYGRVYYVSNDPSEYRSNLDEHFPARTLARICDIPTSFTQLMHITNYAPTYVIDVQYNRTESPYTEDEQFKVWNEYVPKWIRYNNGVVFPQFYSLYEMMRDYLYNGNPHCIYDNLNSYITIPTVENTIIVNDAGSGYTVGDTFAFEIGGQTITGIIESANNGQVLTIIIDDDYSIHYSFLSQASTFATSTISGSGSGLTVDVNVPDYNSYLKEYAGYPEDMFALMFDDINNLWVYDISQSSFDKRYKLSGVNQPDNPYVSDIDIREMEDAFIDDLLNKNIFIPEIYLNKYINDTISIPVTNYSPYISTDIIPLDIDITQPDDLSPYLEMVYQNSQNSMFFIFKQSFENYYRAEKILTYPNSNLNNVILPKNHQLNLPTYSNMSCAFSYTGKDKVQLDMCIFNPWKNTVSGYEWINSGTYVEHSVPNTPRIIVDSLNNSYISEMIHDEAFVTRGNIYMSACDYYDGWIDTLQSELEQMTRDQLLQYIEDHFHDQYCEPLEVERCYIETIDSDIPIYRYSKNDLITYILANTFGDLTKIDGVHLVETVNTNMDSEDYHPMGDFQLLDITTVDPSAKINNSELALNNICYVFKFDSLIANFRDFRMYDADDNDISDKCLIIYDNQAWYWYNNSWNNI